MTSSLLELGLPDRVRNALSAVLPEATIEQIKVADGQSPLLLLRVNQILAAFAFGMDDDTYRSLYDGFKRYFLTKGEQWKSLDVSFVYCVPESTHPAESFCSKVEADVYFCRKFIVTFKDDIPGSLLRLPFLPLAPLKGSPLRPSSAQTLLQQFNVRADLARYLVVPNARGAQSILADCLAEKLGSAGPLMDLGPAHEPRQSQVLDPVRLESITIQNFRAYRKSKTFTFGSAITVLYGPNGFGKTSFFDALDFAVTGGIGRLLSPTSDHALTKAARHLDSEGEPCTVSLIFKRGDETHTVVRDLADPKRAKLDSRKGVDRKDVLSMFTGGDRTAADRVENFISLFRATHLFSQERQELTKDFQDKSELSSNLVSRMLAFEDYVSGIKKTSEIQGIIKSAMERATGEIARLEVLVKRDQMELSRLEGLAASAANPAGIDAEVQSLKDALAMEGIDLGKAPVDASALRSWRAELESRTSSFATRGTGLAQAMGTLQQARSFAQEAITLQSRYAELEATFGALEISRARAEELIQTDSAIVAQARNAEAAAQRAVDALTWLAEKRPELESLKRDQENLKATMDSTSEQDAQLRRSERSAAFARQTVEQSLLETSKQIGALSAYVQSLQSLRGSQPAITAAKTRLQEVSVAERDCINIITTTRAQLEHAKASATSLRREIDRLTSEASAQEAENTEIKSLLSELRGHVTNGTCLLCGVDHGSREALLAHIDARLNLEAKVAEARSRLVEKGTEAAKIADRVASHQHNIDDAQTRQQTLQLERERLEKAVAQFANDAAALDVILSTGSESPEEKIAAALLEAERALGVASEKHKSDSEALALTVREHEDAKVAVASNAAVRQGAADALDRVLEDIASLLGDSKAAGDGFNVDPAVLQAQIEQRMQELQAAKVILAAAQGHAEQHRAELAQRSKEVAATRKTLVDLQDRRGSITLAVSKLATTLNQLDLSPESTDAAVMELIESNSQGAGRLAALKERTTNLEVALDAVTTAAAFASIQATLSQNVASIEKAQSDYERHKPWAQYFDEIAKLLITRQSLATDQFTREYGPRTAVIQRRLRPVYGFGDVQVVSKRGSISVRVERNGQELRPIDYYSQSQIQTLVLGLFLTACSSQTWSAFSSILMDDPVTHFDDLNTYALLDLISGLLQSPDSARQFVIATCDEKLLQLARQKFRHIGDGAKFYRFSAIGTEGPLVSEIPA